MKQYLKMSDVFNLPVRHETLEVYCKESIVSLEDTERKTAHAINSHDELVEMNKELLKTLKNALKECEFEIRHGGQVCVDTYAIRKAIEMAEGSAA